MPTFGEFLLDPVGYRLLRGATPALRDVRARLAERAA